MEKQHNDGQNSAQLNHHIEHLLELLGNLQIDKFVQQNQMARGGNGQPFGDALHNAEENGL